MKKSHFSKLGLCGFLLLFVSLFSAQTASAQTAYIYNNTNCDMDVVLAGLIPAVTCGQCNTGVTVVAAGTNTSVYIPPSCSGADYAAGAHIKASCMSSGGANVADISCSGCTMPSPPSVNSFTIPAGCCYYAVDQKVEVTAVCNGFDVDITIDPIP